MTPKIPHFFPDATRGFLKSFELNDLKDIGINGIMVNSFHLTQRPGIEVFNEFNGLKNWSGYDGYIVSDSGGWQMFSLIQQKGFGKVTEDGIYLNQDGKKILYTPENVIDNQLAVGADLIVCLDYFTPPTGNKYEIDKSIELTTKWASRSKIHFEKSLSNASSKNTKLMAVIQGGKDTDARIRSRDALLEIGFDSYGFGGYLVDENGVLDYEHLKFLASIIPDESIKFALGVGRPWDIATLFDQGWHYFDCTLPSRDARHGRLYTYSITPDVNSDFTNKSNFKYLDIAKTKYAFDKNPIELSCNCPTCLNYNLSYLHSMFKWNDPLVYKLLTTHNLRHYARLIEFLRQR